MEDVTPKPPDPGDSTAAQAAAAEQHQDTAGETAPRQPANFTGQWVHMKNGRIAS